MKKICVAGSLNVDLTINLKRFHQPGETVVATSISTYPGGKGGNQAVAAARLGNPVMMVGMLGDDDNGGFYRRVLKENGVNDSCVTSNSTCNSGMAVIEVDERGENRIAILAGTNGLVNNAFMERMLPSMRQYDIFLMQFEISLDTDCYLAQHLHSEGKTIILDPAPAAKAPEALYRNIDYITPNSSELAALSGMPVGTQEEAVAAAKKLLGWGVGAVIAKLGAKGCLYMDKERTLPVPGFRVEVVDTTAAGDSFNAGFAVALTENQPIESALRFANAVGALSTMGAGAQSSMPSYRQVQAFLAQQ